jgi:hypothetical protein
LNFHYRVGHINDLLFDGSLNDCIRHDHDLLRRSLERARGAGLRAQGLDRIHQVQVLFLESLAQRDGPGQVLIQLLQHRRELGQGLDVLVPGLLVELRDIVRILHKPSRLDYFQGVRGGGEDHRDQRSG